MDFLALNNSFLFGIVEKYDNRQTNRKRVLDPTAF